MPEAVIVSTARSPIGRAFKGRLIGVRPDDLTATIVAAALAKVPGLDPAEIDELIVGCGVPVGEQGGNIARAVAVMLGHDSLPGTTINRYCASSLQSTRMAFHAIKAGEGSAFISAGVDMISRVTAASSASSADLRNPAIPQRTSAEGVWRDPREDGIMPDLFMDMGHTAENVATYTGISRREMDEYALRSQSLAADRRQAGFWQREITPVTLPDGSVMTEDDSPRPGTTLEKLSELQPVFREDGRATAGNSCPINDGAAAVVVMSDVRARELGLTPLARIVSTGVSALSPEIMGLGPVEASRRALANAGLSASDIDLVEINEAFAAQVIPSYRELGFDLDRVNVNGGSIAVGHPYGMTGARITATLLNSLDWHDKQFGLETMCVAGGQGMAMVVERL